MKMMSRALNIIIAVLLISGGVALAQADKQNDRFVSELLRQSGLNKQLEQLPIQMQADIINSNREAGDKLSQADLNELLKDAAEAFNAGALKEIVSRHLRDDLPVNDIREALKWLNSPLGKRISGLEEAASSPEANEEMHQMAGRLPKDKKRVSLLKRLDKAVKATEIGVSITINLQVAFLLAVTADMPPDRKPSTGEILSAVNKDRDQLRRTMAQETLDSFLYTYRSLTNAEIKKYIEFAESPSGRIYHKVAAEGINAAVMRASLTLGSMVSRSLNQDGRGSI